MCILIFQWKKNKDFIIIHLKNKTKKIKQKKRMKFNEIFGNFIFLTAKNFFFNKKFLIIHDSLSSIFTFKINFNLNLNIYLKLISKLLNDNSEFKWSMILS